MRNRVPLETGNWLVICACLALSPAFAAAETKEPGHAEFFEREVRPVLVNRCISCHGAETQESDLRLDSRAAALQGGASGIVLVPGQPKKSSLLEAIAYESDVQMPPDGKLPPREIEVLNRWVEMGAPWPEQDIAGGSMQDRIHSARLSHWAFQPLDPSPAPRASHSWTSNVVDTFVHNKLDQAGLAPSAAADKRTLIRRVTYDLTGLPPTPDQVAEFLADESPNAFEKLVDRLLASPEYGKRWGRHWLDVARYADTRGYSLGREPRLPFAFTYRDYVVRAFNSDKPYDRFVQEQLAADQLTLADRRDLAALGFLTVGRRYSRIHDTIDDRIDVVSRGLVGLTTGCARCHDHKFDPIPTADYYSLYGVFASCLEPTELPLIEERNDSPGHQRFFAELEERQQALDSFLQTKRDELLDHLRRRVGDYLLQVVKRGEVVPAEAGISLGKDEIKPRAVQRWADYLGHPTREKDPVFALWFRFAALDRGDFADGAKVVLEELSGQPSSLDETVWQAFSEQPPKSMVEVAQTYGRLLQQAYQDKQHDHSNRTPVSDGMEGLRKVLFGKASPTEIPQRDLRSYFDRETRNRQRELSRKIEEWNASSPDAPSRAMVLADKKVPVEPVVFERGNPARPGARVPRRFLQVLLPEGGGFQNGSGRFELAMAIASPNNPLTARVFVNRVWLHHFGAGLVTTPSDFGIRTAPPSHPRLLDYLAGEFVRGDWSIKQLHRAIVLSATYRQVSTPREECQTVDPENRLLWRMNRRRLEFEAFRDSLLFVSGSLDRQLGGRPAEMWKPPYSRRSTIYGLIDRQHLAGVLRVFDFASPDASTPRRTLTVVPQQALFAMNSPFVSQRARALIQREDLKAVRGVEARTEVLYEIVFGRPPTAQEQQLAARFIAAASAQERPSSAPPPWQQLAQVLLMSNELMFVD